MMSSLSHNSLNYLDKSLRTDDSCLGVCATFHDLIPTNLRRNKHLAALLKAFHYFKFSERVLVSCDVYFLLADKSESCDCGKHRRSG